jgi:hypothetical protein
MTRFFFLLSAIASTLFAGAQNVGIGTSTPAAKLDVIGSIKITDGTEGTNKILTSGNNGMATWATPPPPPFFSFSTDQSVNNANFVGLGSASSVFIRNTIVVPYNCTLSSIILSTRMQLIPGPVIATVWVQRPPGQPMATTLSAVVSEFNYFGVANGAIPLLLGDLVSVQVTTGSGLISGVAISVTYK